MCVERVCMFVYIYIYIYMYVCIYIYIYIYIYICSYIYLYIYNYVLRVHYELLYAAMCAHIYVHITSYTWVCVLSDPFNMLKLSSNHLLWLIVDYHDFYTVGQQCGVDRQSIDSSW